MADNGFFSAANIARCEAQDIEPLLAVGAGGITRTGPSALASCCFCPNWSALNRMKHRLKPRAERAICGQANSRAGVWHHQVGDALPAVPFERAQNSAAVGFRRIVKCDKKRVLQIACPFCSVNRGLSRQRRCFGFYEVYFQTPYEKRHKRLRAFLTDNIAK